MKEYQLELIAAPVVATFLATTKTVFPNDEEPVKIFFSLSDRYRVEVDVWLHYPNPLVLGGLYDEDKNQRLVCFVEFNLPSHSNPTETPTQPS